MSQHPNVRLTPRGRALLCERVGGVSRQTAHKWLARVGRGEPMADGAAARAGWRGSRHSRSRRASPMRGRGCRRPRPRWSPRRTCRPAPAPESWPAGACRAWTTSTAPPAGCVPAAPSRACATGSCSTSTPRGCRAYPRGRAQGPRARPRVEEGRRDVVPARGRRRQRPGRLRRVGARQEEGDGLRLHGAGDCVLRGPRGRRGARDGRQRVGLPVGRVQRAARGPRHRAQAREALQPLAERQGRAHEQDARARVAVRPRLGERGGRGLRPGLLHRASQLGPSAQRVRGPAPDVTHSRCKQCLGT